MANTIIFGGSGGIGSALAKRLSRKNYKICLAGRNEEDLRTLASEIPDSFVAGGDMTQAAEVDAAFTAAKQNFGSIDVVVNCVGSIVLKPAHLMSDVEFMEVVKTNLLSAFLCIKNAVNYSIGPTKVVLVSSCAATAGLPNHEAISAAKAGVEALTRSAAATYASRGITVNCVAPGLVRTKLSQKLISNSKAEAYSTSLHALGRLGEPDDIAAAIEYLVGEDAGWVTGTILHVDGGLSAIK